MKLYWDGEPTDAPVFYPVSLFLHPKNEQLNLAARRDQHAAMCLTTALFELGFLEGEPILDYPPAVPPDPSKVFRREDLHKVDLSFLAPRSYLLVPTREPIHDLSTGSRKYIRRSYTDLEDHRFALWSTYFETMSRNLVELKPDRHGLLKAPFEDRRRIRFREPLGAAYLELNDGVARRWNKTIESSERRTAAFFLRTEKAWPDGPGMISAFGMDSVATAVWCYRLGRDPKFRHLLAQPGFAMVEMVNPGFRERPTDMLCSWDWDIKILFHEIGERPARAAHEEPQRQRDVSVARLLRDSENKTTTLRNA